MRLSSVLLIIFIVLKLCGLIAWPWVWVLFPFWTKPRKLIVGKTIITAIESQQDTALKTLITTTRTKPEHCPLNVYEYNYSKDILVKIGSIQIATEEILKDMFYHPDDSSINNFRRGLIWGDNLHKPIFVQDKYLDKDWQ